MNILRIHTPPPELAYGRHSGRPPEFSELDSKEAMTSGLNDLNNQFTKLDFHDSKTKIDVVESPFKLNFVSSSTRRHSHPDIYKLNNILIVLDLNGVLCYRIDANLVNKANNPNLDLEFFKVGHKMVYIRPYAREFIEYCLKYYSVGFYTSTTEKNAKPILKKLIDKEHWKQVKFFWYRDHTHPDPEIGKNPIIPNYGTIKSIAEIKSKYSQNRVLICDDSRIKLRFVDKRNQLMVSSFNLSPIFNGKLSYNLKYLNMRLIDTELIKLVQRLYRKTYNIKSFADNLYQNGTL